MINRLYPLNIFCMHGAFCCENLFELYQDMPLVKNLYSYKANSAQEANIIILLGSFTNKLAYEILDQIKQPDKKRFILHIRGCRNRLDNQFTSSRLNHILPINSVLSQCQISKDYYKQFSTEAYQCLRA